VGYIIGVAYILQTVGKMEFRFVAYAVFAEKVNGFLQRHFVDIGGNNPFCATAFYKIQAELAVVTAYIADSFAITNKTGSH
jgi:hypothetical protein